MYSKFKANTSEPKDFTILKKHTTTESYPTKPLSTSEVNIELPLTTKALSTSDEEPVKTFVISTSSEKQGFTSEELPLKTFVISTTSSDKHSELPVKTFVISTSSDNKSEVLTIKEDVSDVSAKETAPNYPSRKPPSKLGSFPWIIVIPAESTKPSLPLPSETAADVLEQAANVVSSHPWYLSSSVIVVLGCITGACLCYFLGRYLDGLSACKLLSLSRKLPLELGRKRKDLERKGLKRKGSFVITFSGRVTPLYTHFSLHFSSQLFHESL